MRIIHSRANTAGVIIETPLVVKARSDWPLTLTFLVTMIGVFFAFGTLAAWAHTSQDHAYASVGAAACGFEARHRGLDPVEGAAACFNQPMDVLAPVGRSTAASAGWGEAPAFGADHATYPDWTAFWVACGYDDVTEGEEHTPALSVMNKVAGCAAAYTDEQALAQGAAMRRLLLGEEAI